MRIELEKCVREGGSVDARLSLGALEWEQGALLEASPVSLRGRFERSRRGFDLNAHLEGSVTLECVRCLSAFQHSLSFDFHLMIVPGRDQPRAGETQIQQADCDLYPCSDGKADLVEIATEQVYLQIPLKPVCVESCRGLCARCGENINHGPCRCSDPVSVRLV